MLQKRLTLMVSNNLGHMLCKLCYVPVEKLQTAVEPSSLVVESHDDICYLLPVTCSMFVFGFHNSVAQRCDLFDDQLNPTKFFESEGVAGNKPNPRSVSRRYGKDSAVLPACNRQRCG